MEDKNIKIIEINGIKMEVDMRTVKVVSNYKIGSKVKVLKKTGYNNEMMSYPGIIVGFDNFEKLPTIIISYLEVGYQTADVKFLYFNSELKDTEICPMNENDIPFNSVDVEKIMSNTIVLKRKELTELQNKRDYFINNFNKYFGEIKETEPELV